MAAYAIYCAGRPDVRIACPGDRRRQSNRVCLSFGPHLLTAQEAAGRAISSTAVRGTKQGRVRVCLSVLTDCTLDTNGRIDPKEILRSRMSRTAFDVYQYEMKPFRKISEQDLDRLFSGKAPADNSGLSKIEGLVHGLRTMHVTDVDREVEASHLARLMEVVNLTDKGELAARPASKATGSDRQMSGLSKWRKVMLESVVGAFVMKILGGAVALAAATGGLAALDVLPDPAQARVADAVEAISPFDLPGNADEEAVKALEKAAEAAKQVTEEDADESGEPNENAEFGQSVAADAKDGGVDGQEISEEARQRAAERRAAGQANRPDGVGTQGPENAGPPADAGSQSQTGLEKASDTPAGGHIPGSVPGGPGTAEQYKPEGTPGGPSSGVGAGR